MRGLDGSVREIAEQSGYSAAAIYTYFQNKEELFAETLSRRGLVLLDVVTQASAEPGDAMAKLQAIVEATFAFFAEHPDFRQMLRHVRNADATIPAVVLHYAGDRLQSYAQVLDVMLAVIKDGQAAGLIRTGSPSALLHFFMTLTYEQVFLTSADITENLTPDEFHELIDGALRRGKVHVKSRQR